MSFDASFSWAVLGSGGLLERPYELDAWRALLESAESYPTGTYMPPMRPPRRRDKAKELAVLDWTYDGPDPITAGLQRVSWAADGDQGAEELSGAPGDAAAAFLGLLEAPGMKGRMLASWGAAEGAFHAFLRQLARPLVALGVTIEPIATGTRCKALIIRKGRRAWWLTDVQEMTGGSALSRSQFETEYAPRSVSPEGSPRRLLEALASFQRSLLGMFGVSLRPTIGASALRAAQEHVPSNAWLWRPSPLMVSLCRVGRAMRGGYSTATRFDGPAYRADMNKAYTAALGEQLPARSALVAHTAQGQQPPGIYLCHVAGPGRMPAYLGRWKQGEHVFSLDYWNGLECWAVLTSAEIPGLEALGFRVTTRGGFRFVKTWTLEPFVQKVAAMCAIHGRGSAHERTAKIIGNSVYGKLAERPDRDEVMYAAERPGDGWYPMLDIRGDELPDLWTRQTVTHRPGQHVDVAAHITGIVRGRLYEACAVALAVGGEVVHADTDGLLSTVDLSPYFQQDESEPGTWRIDREPQRAIVWGPKGYAYGDEVRAAGFSGLDVEDAERIAQGAAVETTYTTRGAPWSGSAPGVGLPRTARATA